MKDREMKNQELTMENTHKIKRKMGEVYYRKKIFLKNLIGKCSVYKDELRAASASYTAQEFNLLNDFK
mgnify:CR=1 FL=1